MPDNMKHIIELAAALIIGSFLGTKFPDPSPLLVVSVVGIGFAIWSASRRLYGLTPFAFVTQAAVITALLVMTTAQAAIKNLFEIHFALAALLAMPLAAVAYLAVQVLHRRLRGAGTKLAA